MNICPRSAGFEPGPACYDKGGEEATLTDALLLLGIYPESFLGEKMKLNTAEAKKAIGVVAEAHKSSEEAAAESIYRLANDIIFHYIDGQLSKKGYDPRDFTLIAYGGAGPACAPYVARELQAKRVIIPPYAGVFTGLGLLTIDLVHDMVRSYLTFVHLADLKKINDIFSTLEKEAWNILKAEHVKDEDITLVKMADTRYFNQSNIISVTLPQQESYQSLDLISSSFHQMHHKLYGHSFEEDPVELVALKVRGIGKLPTLKLEKIEKTRGDFKQAVKGQREVLFPLLGKKVSQVIDRSLLLAGDKIPGPAIIEESVCTTVIPPDMQAEVDNYGNIVINL